MKGVFDMGILAEAATFDVSSALTTISSVMTSLLDIIKGEPILAAAFVGAVILPVGFKIIRGVKRTAR